MWTLIVEMNMELPKFLDYKDRGTKALSYQHFIFEELFPFSQHELPETFIKGKIVLWFFNGRPQRFGYCMESCRRNLKMSGYSAVPCGGELEPGRSAFR